MMNKTKWYILLAIVFSIVAIGSLFYGNVIPDIIMGLFIFGIIPLVIIFVSIAFYNKNMKIRPAIAVIVLALITAILHLNLKVPFYVLAIVASILFVRFRLNKYRKHSMTVKISSEIGITLFFIYILFVFYLTFSPFQFFAPYSHTLEMELIPFKEISEQFGRAPELAAYYAFGNLAMTIPFGLFIPLLFNRIQSLWKIVCYGCVFSLTIELLQMVFTQRSAEIDDLIFNTLGAVIGFLVFIQVKRVFSKKGQ
jgi:glycopeptide antibiotics resistance protein